ncbi:electron transfer flavoprotein subunit alpha/FixB family protein [Demequina zhanjiangensis]|uniref:Electron transfer flavoprotein subunit alpha/FixB family protein n=1 Tax=Demequina zhanjiangensis TaxID=3051659 RepID=A0ABT8FY19_9MICO|nr:electron transfer flavoprotein subunit alpha/FixB family protein [Demequina sp. SYSU T00b26]MDN4471796.1 electron transfer flavoprotein subunit alpha/FixB family protein [Demequina sp. SYSU T00b26]
MSGNTVAVLVEHRDGVVAQPTLENLTLARSLGEPVAVWLGEPPSDEASATLGAYGAGAVRVVELGAAGRLPKVRAAAVGAATPDAPVVLMTSTFLNKEVATLLALETGAGVVVDASGAELADGRVETEQTVFAATWNIRTRVVSERAIVALRPNTTQATEVDGAGAATVETVVFEAPEVPERLVAVSAVEREEGVPLAEARVVVSGGRGTNGDYALVRDLADVLGGAVGATRDATDEGWISHEHMVGQTGTTVTPALYVACGISGAVHHRGGMQASGTIVAVNIDPDAPIFEIADLGIVGDLNDVLPQAIATLQEHKGA